MSRKQHDLILISLQFRKVISVHYVALQLDLATRSTRGNLVTVKFLSFE